MPLSHKSLLATAVITLTAVICVSAQDSGPRFELASLRVSPNQYIGRAGLLYAVPGGRLTAEGITLRGLLFEAYDKFKLMVHREKRSGSFSTSVLVIDSITGVSEN